MSTSLYLVVGTETANLCLERQTLEDNGYLVEVALSSDGVGLQQIVISRPSIQLAVQYSLEGIESCLPNNDCSFRRQVELVNSSLTGYQKKLALECFPSEATNRLFNSFLIGFCYVLTIHSLCYSGYNAFNVKLNGNLRQSITRNNAYTFLRNCNTLLDPFDTCLVNGYRNFWRVWAGCFSGSEYDQELEDLAMWVNGDLEESVDNDCSQMFTDLPRIDALFADSSPRSPRSPSPSKNTPNPGLELNPIFSQLDEYRVFMGEMVHESRVIQLENYLRDLQANINDLESKYNNLSNRLDECDEKVDHNKEECLIACQKEEEPSRECCSEDRLITLEKQMATYTTLLKNLAVKLAELSG